MNLKRWLGIVLVAALLAAPCGCASVFGSDAAKENERLRQENERLKSLLIDNGIDFSAVSNGASSATDADASGGASSAADTDASGGTVVLLNTPYTVENVLTFTLIGFEWCDEIKPSDTSGVYSYYSDNEGEKFFAVRGTVKNLSNQALDLKYAGEAELLINGQYRVSATMETEESDGTSFYGSVKSLQTCNMIFYASVSDELYASAQSVRLSFDLTTDAEHSGFYRDSDPHESFEITFNM